MPLLRLLLFVLALCAPLPALAQDGGPTGEISTENNAQQDAGIAVRIRQILEELGGFQGVTVTVAEGIVTLRGELTSAAEIGNLTAIVTRVQGVVAIKNEVHETADIVRRLNPAMERFQARIDQIVVALPLLLIAGGAFLAISFAGNVISRWRQPWDRLAPNAFIADLYRQIVQLVFVLGGLVLALDILDASALLGTILGAAGIVGLAIGFAVRDTVENYIASIMLSVRQPFGPNDTIEINGDIGKVIRLTSRSTILLSFDGNQIRIPNATVFKSRIVNYSQNPQIRFQFTLAIGQECNVSEARDLATETVQALPFVIDSPAASSWIADITDRGVEIIVTGWVDQRETSALRARGEALRLVKLAYLQAGITMPDATYRIRIDGGPAGTAPMADEGARRAATQVPQTAPPAETQAVAQVDAASDAALEKMVEAERHDSAKQNLLVQSATNE